MEPRDRHRHARLTHFAAQLVQCDVAACLVQHQHRLAVRLDPSRPRIPALWLGGVTTCAAALVVPADYVAAATPNRVAAARQLIPSSTAASARDRRSINDGLLIHASLHPASSLNQISMPV